MILNDESFKRILAMFPKMPYTSAEYCGCWSDGIYFKVAAYDKYENIICGCTVITNDKFEKLRVERLDYSWGKFYKNFPVLSFRVPISSDGQLPVFANPKLQAWEHDYRSYIYYPILRIKSKTKHNGQYYSKAFFVTPQVELDKCIESNK